MNLQTLSWRTLPWVKATRPQWRYALRNGIAMCLALSIAYALDLDEPYWAMTSAAVVSFPTVGGVISKSFGRIAGSLLGACAALLLAGHTLNDPWLFLFSISGWLALCTWACALFTNNVAYAFQLAGYTCAIIAFPVINISDSYELWVIAQSRVCEVIVGILCGGLMMMILPSTSDGSNLLTALKTMHARLLEHASLLWVPETTDAIRTAHESVIGQILTMNLLRIQAFWSHYRFRRQNPLLNYLLHQQLRMTSVISSLRRMLLNWPDAPANTRQVLESLLAELATPHADSYHVARILVPLAPRQDADYRHIAFWARLRYFCRIYLESSRWIRRVENASAIAEFNVPAAPPLARHTDQAEALLNGVPYLLRAGGDWRMGDQYPVDQLRGGPDPGLHLLRALLRIRLAVSLADIADADSGPAVAIQFRGEVRPDGAGNRPVAVSAVPVPAPDHHAVTQTAVAQIRRPVGTAYRLYGLVYRRHQPAGVRLCGLFQ